MSLDEAVAGATLATPTVASGNSLCLWLDVLQECSPTMRSTCASARDLIVCAIALRVLSVLRGRGSSGPSVTGFAWGLVRR